MNDILIFNQTFFFVLIYQNMAEILTGHLILLMFNVHFIVNLVTLPGASAYNQQTPKLILQSCPNT